MICLTGRVMRVGAATRLPVSWPRSCGRWRGWPGWGCSTRRSVASWDGCASVPAGRARAARRRRARRREADMRAGRAGEAGWPVLLAGAAVGVWGWRLELAVLGAAVAAQRLAAGRVGELAAAV